MEIKDNKDIENQIIEIAKIIFVEKGYEATKMGDIANQVGISRTAMHYYFRTKDMLFDAIFGHLINTLLPNLESIMHQPGTMLEKFPAIIREYNAILLANPRFPLFVLSELNRDPEHLYKAIMKNAEIAQTILHLRKQILNEMENGLLKKIPLINLLSTFLSLMVFPLLIKKPFSDVLLDRDEEVYNQFLKEREIMIYNIIKGMVDPNNK